MCYYILKVNICSINERSEKGRQIMISYIKGVVDSVESDRVVIENNQIGYNILMPVTALETLGIGEEVKIYTYFNVREDAMQLFGFFSKEELELFKSLLDQLPEEKKKEVKAEYKRPYLTDKYTMEDGTIIILKSF